MRGEKVNKFRWVRPVPGVDVSKRKTGGSSNTPPQGATSRDRAERRGATRLARVGRRAALDLAFAVVTELPKPVLALVPRQLELFPGLDPWAEPREFGARFNLSRFLPDGRVVLRCQICGTERAPAAPASGPWHEQPYVRKAFACGWRDLEDENRVVVLACARCTKRARKARA